MNKDKEIDELFKSFNPDVNTEGVMTKISDKMDVIDMVRHEQDRMNRFHRTVSVCCFSAGLIIGITLMFIVFFRPSPGNVMLDLVHLNQNLSGLALFYTDHRDMLLTFLAAASIILGSLPLICSNEWTRSL